MSRSKAELTRVFLGESPFVMKIMIVEDEQGIRDILISILKDEGFDVVALEDGMRVLEELKTHRPSILLLDQILPGKSGVEVVKELRATQEFRWLPIIMVTGLSGEDDKVAALELGADDYVTKPFYPKELAARIKSLARRTESDKQAKAVAYRDLQIDFNAHRVVLEGQELALTLTEFKILSELLKKSGQVLTREKLREYALGNLNVTDRTIDVHMASLRKKLNNYGDYIETVRGVGYRFATN